MSGRRGIARSLHLLTLVSNREETSEESRSNPRACDLLFRCVTCGVASLTAGALPSYVLRCLDREVENRAPEAKAPDAFRVWGSARSSTGVSEVSGVLVFLTFLPARHSAQEQS
jgi:hypothetical protein